MIFDTHAHYDDDAFNEDRETLLDSMASHGVGYIVNVSSSVRSISETLGMIKRFPYLMGAIGVHPSEVAELDEETFEWMKKQVHKPKIVAIGEIGLDYHWHDPAPELQKEWFIRQLQLAKEAELPVIIHSRDAAADTLQIMKEQDAASIGGVVHCFSYGPEMAREYLNMGFYLGIGGVLTFKNGKKLKEVVEMAPMDRIVLETDCPYLSPEPNRGRRNSSLNLPYVVGELARIKGLSPQEVISITEANAKALYRMN